ncbi:GNAT family N-acetyltransferase [Exiguobacterium aurantiacum]|uniref:GNAT family N-acetyltransferase n=1 Tax=Exiguobacterium aurantiacum TaxID=33987 RepID=A0ABY5FNY3_9BACL|nr:GNAT family N-acetyltransferase [Exiguobacterium aurantiacum]UTT43299.1 GNAT family N-acetyltransferase [Exiguobacterium aurantiacum]
MIHVYDTTWREKVEAFLLQQRSFAALNGQTPETFRDENVSDFETEETVSLVFEERDVIAVADLLKKHPVDGSLWLGLFVGDERLHGTGVAQRLYEQLEHAYMRPFQPVFRLGVLPHNERARRFWERQGYVYEKDSVTARGDHVHVLKKVIV